MESIRIEDQSQVAEARRRARACAAGIGLSEQILANIALCVTEVATNILKHALRGEILIECAQQGNYGVVQVIALDKGPGIGDINAAMRDGYSTAGSSGTGLGAMARLASHVEIFAPKNGGTAMLMEFRSIALPRVASFLGAISIPKFGESICGDSWGVKTANGVRSLIVADGLGHGPLAAEASMKAVAVFRADRSDNVGETLTAIHTQLRDTRGAAVSILRLGQEADFCGVGNVAGGLYNSVDGKRMVSEIGTAGLVARRVNKYSYPLEGFSLAILASDGLTTGWSLHAYPTLIGHDPTLIAAVLYRDFCRGTDDATVVVMRIGSP